MGYKIKEGQRTIAIKVSYAAWWNVCWANIFVDCATCDQSIGLKFDSNDESDAFSNDEFLQIVRSKGWAVLPNRHIACPSCRKAARLSNTARTRLSESGGKLPAKISNRKVAKPVVGG